MNNRLLYGLNSTECTFLHPVSATDMKYVIVKIPQPTNLLHFHLIQTFDWATKVAYGVTFVIVVAIGHLLNKFKAKITGSDSADFGKLLLMVIGIQSSIAIEIRGRLPTYQRILISSLLIFSLIICNSFQGAILTNLTHPKKTVNINTLNDLLKSDLNLTALITIPDLFKPNDDATNVNQLQLKLYERQMIDTNVDELHAIELLQDAKQAVLSKYLEFFKTNY